MEDIPRDSISRLEYARPASRDAYLRIGVVGAARTLRCAAAISTATQRYRARLCDDDAVW